jgi:NTE family protein
VLPAGGTARDDSARAYRDTTLVETRIEAAYDGSRAYLEEHL